MDTLREGRVSDFPPKGLKNMSGKLLSPDAIRAYIEGGNATVTLRDIEEDIGYTYKIKQVRGEDEKFFIAFLKGPDNESDFTYIGMMVDGWFRATRSSKLSIDSLPSKLFIQLLDGLHEGQLPVSLEVWHEGKCARCGRKLTVPESIESGFGPECASLRR